MPHSYVQCNAPLIRRFKEHYAVPFRRGRCSPLSNTSKDRLATNQSTSTQHRHSPSYIFILKITLRFPARPMRPSRTALESPLPLNRADVRQGWCWWRDAYRSYGDSSGVRCTCSRGREAGMHIICMVWMLFEFGEGTSGWAEGDVFTVRGSGCAGDGRRFLLNWNW
jgi:hypothetical protein